MTSFDLGTIHGAIDFDTSAFDRKYAQVDALLDKLESRQVPEVKVDADTAMADRKLTATETFVSGVLDGMQAEIDVAADTDQADRKLSATESFVSGVIDGMQAEVGVRADTSAAEAELDAFTDKAGRAGVEAGDKAGGGLSDGLITALKAAPFVGAILLAGVALGKSLLDGIKDGLSQEVTRDLFSARTGLDTATSAKFARAAGNAYADAFGESVEANLDLSRHALQLGLIDADATTVEIEKIISKIDSLAMLSEEDARRVATATDVMLSTGIVKSADEAFDVLLRGFQKGVDSGEDLLDTFIEYPALFDKLGLSAEEAMGLMNQGLEAGARNSDFVADALKEFQIRATDASDASAAGFERIGLNAEEMTAKIAAGGEGARQGLDQVLDGLRKMEDPVERNAAGVELFGTKWEDLGDAMLALDVDTAVADLGEVEGALQSAMDTLGQNPATAIEEAQRSIEVSADGIKAALAAAFSEPLTDLSDWVSGNRAGVTSFFGGLVNLLFDMSRTGVEGVATLIEAFGDFMTFGIEPILLGVLDVIYAMDNIPGINIDSEGIADDIYDMVGGLRETRWGAYEAAEGLRENLIENGIDPVQDRFNEFLADEIVSARVHDLTSAMVEDITSVGESIENLDGVSLDKMTGQFDTGTAAGAELDEQLRTAIDSMWETQAAAIAAGEGQGELNERVGAAKGLLVEQLTQMGYTEDQAYDLIEAYGAIPSNVDTKVSLDTSGARGAWADFYQEYNGRTLTAYQIVAQGGRAYVATGGDVDAHAAAAMQTHFGGGGAVLGAGDGTSDSIPAGHPSGVQFWLSNGEHVLDADDVVDLGGQQGAYMLRAMIQAGMVKPLEHSQGMAGGGGVGSSAPARSTNSPAPFTPAELADAVAGAMARVLTPVDDYGLYVMSESAQRRFAGARGN